MYTKITVWKLLYRAMRSGKYLEESITLFLMQLLVFQLKRFRTTLNMIYSKKYYLKIFFQEDLGVFFRYSQFLFIEFHFNSNNLLQEIKGQT